MKNMRKYALAMLTLVSLTLAVAMMGCGKKTEEETTTPPAESTMPADTSMAPDTTMADTTMSH